MCEAPEAHKVGATTQETERLALLGTMAAVFAHEAGNPLAGILLSLKCVESQLEKQEVNDPSLISTIRGAIGEIGRLGSLLQEFRSLVLYANSRPKVRRSCEDRRRGLGFRDDRLSGGWNYR